MMLVPLLLILSLGSLSLCEDTSSDTHAHNGWFTSLWRILTSDELESSDETVETVKEDMPRPTTPSNDDDDDDVNNDDVNNESVTDEVKSNEESQNVIQTRVRHTCIPYEGCTPPLNCSNLTNINDSNLVGMTNQGCVVGINTTQLHYLLGNVSHTNMCAIVMFFDPRCIYSVAFGPVYNKLGVVFPQLPIVAIDYGNYSSDLYLLAYVPRVILYYAGRVVYDIDTDMDIGNLTQIIANMTGVIPNPIPSDEVMAEYESPIPKEVVEDNTMLYLSIASIVIICLGNWIQKSDLFAKWMERLFPTKTD